MGQRRERADLQQLSFSDLLDQFAQLYKDMGRAVPFSPEWWTLADTAATVRAELHQRTH